MKSSSTLLLLPILLSACSEKELDPNVLIILIDDAGYADFGFMGNKDLSTPNIDNLALQGTIFSDAHVVAAVSAPSRVSLMTGRYGHRFGYEGNPPRQELGVPASELTLAEVLKEKGYVTGAVGKWHLGSKYEQHPNRRGFDFFYGMKSGGRTYFYNPNRADKPGDIQNILRNDKQERFDGYLTDVFTDEAIGFMTESKDPFFLYLAYNAVHTPMDATKEDLARFEGHPRQKLAAMTWALDRGVGRIVASLKASGKFENTLIYFISDNGGATNNKSSNFPYKGFKGYKYEGGHRVPFFVVHGDRFRSDNKFNGLTSSLDIFATTLDVVGIDSENLENKIDGVSLLPYLTKKKEGNPHRMLFWRKTPTRAVRCGDYKLIFTEGMDTVLYNLSEEIGEITDLSKREPEKTAEMLNYIEEWESKCIPPKWVEEGWEEITDSIQRLLIYNTIYDSKDLLNRSKVKNEK